MSRSRSRSPVPDWFVESRRRPEFYRRLNDPNLGIGTIFMFVVVILNILNTWEHEIHYLTQSRMFYLKSDYPWKKIETKSLFECR